MVLSVLLEMYKGGNDILKTDNCDVLVIVGIRYSHASVTSVTDPSNLAFAIFNPSA